MKAILTVIGRDRSGIIARTSMLLYKHDANIEDLTQTVLSGYFTMVMLIDLSAMTISFEELQAELKGLKEKSDKMTAQWKEEKSALEDVRRVRTRLEEERNRYERAEAEGNLNEASRLKYGVIPELEKKLKTHEDDLHQNRAAALLREEVTADEIAEVVSRWSGIPVTKLVEGEREKLMRLAGRSCTSG